MGSSALIFVVLLLLLFVASFFILFGFLLCPFVTKKESNLILFGYKTFCLRMAKWGVC
jgi:ABC-type uncharacterized transport system permease subunit